LLKLVLTAYSILAALIIYYGVSRSTPGATRVFAFASLFSLFFGLGLIVGHGALPAPALLILISCPFTHCVSDLYGDARTMALLTIVPVILQWPVVLAISFGTYGLLKLGTKSDDDEVD
jgi:hypothetical protein